MSNLDFSENIIHSIPDYIYVIDMENYEIVFANKALRNLLGNPSEEVLTSTPCYKLLQGKDEPCPFCNSENLKVDTPAFWSSYNPLFKCWITYKDEKIVKNGKNYRLEIAKDYTDSKEKKELLEDLFEEKRILIECVNLLESTESIEISVQKMLSLIAEFHDADRAYMFDFDDKSLVATFKHGHTRKKDLKQLSILHTIDFDHFKPLLDAFNKGQPFRVKDRDTDYVIQNDPVCHIELIRYNLNSLIVVPLRNHDGRIMALLGVDNPKQRILAESIIAPISSFFLDCFEKQKTIEKLYHLSFTDGLTQIKNSHRFLEDLKEFELHPPKTCGIAYVDINGLKKVNDTEGHDAGNELITSAAKILKEVFPDTAYRTGGDEFIILQPDCTESFFVEKLKSIKEKAKLEKNLQVAIGHSWTDITANGLSKYIQEADAAMYTDKKEFYSTAGLDRRK